MYDVIYLFLVKLFYLCYLYYFKIVTHNSKKKESDILKFGEKEAVKGS